MSVEVGGEGFLLHVCQTVGWGVTTVVPPSPGALVLDPDQSGLSDGPGLAAKQFSVSRT